MVFGRRKSSGRPESFQEELDATRRTNRLSKPRTNKSSTNLALLAVQEPGSNSNNASTDALVGSMPLSPKASDLEARREIKTHVFDGEICKDPAKPANEGAWGGVALMVSKFEANTSFQPPLQSPPKLRRPFSNIFSTRNSSASLRPSLTSANSKDRLAPLKDDSESPVVSLDKPVDTPVFPSSRRASFQPGTATRKSSWVGSLRDEVQIKSSPQVEPSVIEEEDALDGDDETCSFDEGDDEDWLPPAEIARTDTPNSLDYTHLGGLRLGSLHVVNGRASPAASEMSRHLLARVPISRHASSEYGSELEDSNDQTYTDSQTPPIGHSREVSCYSNRSVKAPTPIFAIARKPLPQTVVFATPPKHCRDASAVAAEYISELPASPYALRRSCSEGSLTKIEAVERATSIYSIHIEPEQGDARRSRSSSFTSQSHRSGSPSSLMSDTGSVLRTRTKKTEIEDQLFDDEAIGSSVTPGRTPERNSLESLQSWHSPMKPEYERNEAFESAVEFQPYNPQDLPLQCAGRPIDKQRIISPLMAPMASMERLQPPQQEQTVKSDSGYSSNNSVRSYSSEHGRKNPTVAPTPTAVAAALGPPAPTRVEQPVPNTATRFFKPILKSKKTAPAVPTFNDIRPAPLTTTTSLSDNPKAETPKEKPKPKKLQKRNLLGKKKSLFVQSVGSIDDLSIPSISSQMSANLHVRTQEVPELEKTFRSMHHVRNQESMSTMDLSKLNLRFPSPTPESEQILQPPNRKSSGGRRRSWFGKPKDDEARHSSDISERDARTVINDFGTVASSLGGSPYDLAHEKSRVLDSGRGKLNPYNISTKAPRPRSMFDDNTAAEIARLRSSTIRERDAFDGRRPSFNDRGGIPGKNLKPTRVAMDAPPMPPLPMRSAPERQDSQQQQQQQQHYQHCPQGDVLPPPLPPKHPPRPSFVEPADYFEGPHYEEEPMAPPPPSHSPRPVDVSPRPSPRASPRPEQQVRDPWAAQAAMWKARRQSAGQTLKRQSWQEGDYQPAEHAIEDEPLYPSIPERSPAINRHGLAQARHYSTQPGALAQNHHEYHQQQFDQNHGAQMQQYQQHMSYQHPIYTFQTQPYQPDPHESQSRPLPPGPRSPSKSPHGSRPNSRSPSRHSARSYASSMAEEIHPENYTAQRRPQPPNDFGRYSGGLGYGYEGKDKGFTGSAGTRTVSGKADGAFKGVQLRGQYGVDLGDVPVMGVLKPVENFRRL